MYNIFLIGDSQTDLGFKNGWGYFFKQWYQNKATIYNKSICNSCKKYKCMCVRITHFFKK